MNGQDHAHEAERLLVHADEQYHSQEVVMLSVGQAQVHATLAVAYAQAGAWKDVPSPDPETLVVHPLRPSDPRNKITTHVREVSDQGPDLCRPCTEAIGDRVPWPCAGALSSRACGDGAYALGCCRARGHDGNHLAADGFNWADA